MKAGRAQELFARYVEQHVLHGRRPDPESLCREDPELLEAVREYIREYEFLQETLVTPEPLHSEAAEAAGDLPVFEGFRTIERVGGGGGGQVYKLQDLDLGRFVAAKVIRPDSPLRSGLEEFLREARSLALFDDSRIVTVFEFRGNADPPVLLMEYVDGFELGRIGRSLEYSQRARVVRQIAEAIDRAHRLGIQHRDLKPANVMLDAGLTPKILDFGLSRGERDRGHGLGTLSYMAPEQLDPRRPIDARTDVYALGIMLYELLCGALPYEGRDTEELIAEIARGTARLPVEIQPDVPEPLQAIALKAMEREPADRYRSMHELSLDLQRYVDGKPVVARPSLYQSALARRVRPHLEQIREWLRIHLIHPHEAEHLHRAYEGLEAREVDWIVHSRSLSYSQISLYLGAFLLAGGSLLYFYAYFLEAVQGIVKPALVLGLPFVVLNVTAHRLFRRERQAVAVAFYLGAVLLMPLFLVIFFEEAGLWPAAPEDGMELFGEGYPSNRQLQLASLAACLWAGWLALRTRTLTLSILFTALVFVLDLTVLGDFGLRPWIEDGEWHLLATRLTPLLLVVAALGRLAERREKRWLTQPLYFFGLGLFMVILELLALNGKMFHYVGLSMSPFHGEEVSDPLLLDSIAAMTLNGLLIYSAGWLLENRGSPLMRRTSWLAYVLSPFTILHPLSYLVAVGEYSLRYDWFYLVLALAITFLSHFRQRKSFYYAGLLNTGIALYYITDHHEWFDRPLWAIFVAATGIAVLASGGGMYFRERNRHRAL